MAGLNQSSYEAELAVFNGEVEQLQNEDTESCREMSPKSGSMYMNGNASNVFQMSIEKAPVAEISRPPCHLLDGASEQSPHPPQPSSLRLLCARPQGNPAWSQGIRAQAPA
jgi:hypothetical protein